MVKRETTCKIGKNGEKLAIQFLKNKGFKIITKNYYTKFGEIDIIAEKKDLLIFIEVKTRHTDKFGSPQESITKTKKQKIYLSIKTYLSKNKVNKQIRFDVIGIKIKRNKAYINHIKDIYL